MAGETVVEAGVSSLTNLFFEPHRDSYIFLRGEKPMGEHGME